MPGSIERVLRFLTAGESHGRALVVIVEGSVRVVRGEGDEQRVLRTYQAGDHIGELAVLRERPRAATVLADAPAVRGLVIGGEGLRMILRERPGVVPLHCAAYFASARRDNARVDWREGQGGYGPG